MSLNLKGARTECCKSAQIFYFLFFRDIERKRKTKNSSRRTLKSVGVSNKTGGGSTGNEEDLKKAATEPVDKLSQGSLPSTPTKSVGDTDTNTDYESADEGQEGITDLTLLSRDLQQLHLSTPGKTSAKKPTSTGFRFPASPADATVYLSSPDSLAGEDDGFNTSWASVVDKTQYKSIYLDRLLNEPEQDLSNSSVVEGVNAHSSKSFVENAETISTGPKCSSFQQHCQNISDTTVNITANEFESLDNSKIKPSFTLLEEAANRFVLEKSFTELDDKNNDFGSICSAEQLTSNCLENSFHSKKTEEEKRLKDIIDEVELSFENVTLEIETSKEKSVGNTSASIDPSNISSKIENSDDLSFLKEGLEDINVSTSAIKEQSTEIIVDRIINNVSDLNISKSKESNLSINNSEKPTVLCLEEEEEKINSLSEVEDAKANKNSSVSGEIQEFVQVNSDKFRSIESSAEQSVTQVFASVNDTVSTENISLTDVTVEEAHHKSLTNVSPKVNKELNDLEFRNAILSETNSEEKVAQNPSSPCFTFKVYANVTSILTPNSDVVCEEKLNLDKNSEVFDLKQQREFVSTESSAVGAPLIDSGKEETLTAEVSFNNQIPKNTFYSTRINNENITQDNKNIESPYCYSSSNNQLFDNRKVLEKSLNVGETTKEFKLVDEFSPLNVSSASEKELQENIENCTALLLEEINDADRRLNEDNISVRSLDESVTNIIGSLDASPSEVNVSNVQTENCKIPKLLKINELNTYKENCDLNTSNNKSALVTSNDQINGSPLFVSDTSAESTETTVETSINNFNEYTSEEYFHQILADDDFLANDRFDENLEADHKIGRTAIHSSFGIPFKENVELEHKCEISERENSHSLLKEVHKVEEENIPNDNLKSDAVVHSELSIKEEVKEEIDNIIKKAFEIVTSNKNNLSQNTVEIDQSLDLAKEKIASVENLDLKANQNFAPCEEIITSCVIKETLKSEQSIKYTVCSDEDVAKVEDNSDQQLVTHEEDIIPANTSVSDIKEEKNIPPLPIEEERDLKVSSPISKSKVEENSGLLLKDKPFEECTTAEIEFKSSDAPWEQNLTTTGEPEFKVTSSDSNLAENTCVENFGSSPLKSSFVGCTGDNISKEDSVNNIETIHLDNVPSHLSLCDKQFIGDAVELASLNSTIAENKSSNVEEETIGKVFKASEITSCSLVKEVGNNKLPEPASPFKPEVDNIFSDYRKEADIISKLINSSVKKDSTESSEKAEEKIFGKSYNLKENNVFPRSETLVDAELESLTINSKFNKATDLEQNKIKINKTATTKSCTETVDVDRDLDQELIDEVTTSVGKLSVEDETKLTERQETLDESFPIVKTINLEACGDISRDIHLDEQSSLKEIIKEENLETLNTSSIKEESGQLSPPTAAVNRHLFTTNSLQESIQNQLNRSYRDLSELIATCSKQERELAEEVNQEEIFDLPEKFETSIRKEADLISEALMAEAIDEQEKMNQHIMQLPPSADINTSEAGPITADEDFRKGEFFQDATDIDFELTPARLAPRLTRQSLYVKFDPLIEAALAAEADSEDSNITLVSKMADIKIGEGANVEKTPRRDRNRGDQTLIMINTPGKPAADLNASEKLNNSSPSTPSNTTKRSLAGSGGTPSLREEVSKLQDLMIEQEQVYVEQLAEKNDMIESLRKRVLELETKEPRAELEDRLKNRELEAAKMKKELTENSVSNKQLLTIMEEYEKAIASTVKRREDEKTEFEKVKEQICAERDTALHHLSNMEVAFNDIHSKYERCKNLIETLHDNEKRLLQTIEEQKKAIELHEQSYVKLKQHASEKIIEANQEIASAHKGYQAEIAKMKAVTKKTELKVKSLEESLEQKKKEVRELTQICDELIEKI
ncbi:uncharacterized protein isoform X2 [Rhodnius prolixus]|uniref:uncharacterized protein isoform X2 n=1 Tax=Rhodnius prolixus TaxID=13249 RepID=UPI003D18AC94